MVNKKQSYALVNEETGKVIKYNGKLQYYRVKQLATMKGKKLQTELGIKVGIKKLKFTTMGGRIPKKQEKNNEKKVQI